MTNFKIISKIYNLIIMLKNYKKIKCTENIFNINHLVMDIQILMVVHNMNKGGKQIFHKIIKMFLLINNSMNIQIHNKYNLEKHKIKSIIII